MHKTLLLLLSGLLIGCGASEKKPTTVFFGGEIVNPTSDYVILYKDDIVIDSAKLDDQNRFAFNLNSVDEGLHHFDHKPELQYVYLEKGDSLMARLNTVDFDESLAFSGKGEEINNFLLDMYLTQEAEEFFINSLYLEEPAIFSRKIDSLRAKKNNLLSDLRDDMLLDKNAVEIAQASIDYNYYIHKETYPFYQKKKSPKEIFKELPEDFYAYRKKLNLNNDNLTYFRPYYNYLKYHYGNMSFEECNHECAINKKDPFSYLHFYQHKLRLIDNHVEQKTLRDNLFRNVALDFLLKAHETQENNRAFINQFHHLSSNNKHMEEIDQLYADINKIQPNKAVPDVSVHCTKGKKTYLKDISKGENPVVFYFWSGTQKRHFENLSKHIKELEKKYPKKNFVGINVKTDSLRWLAMVKDSPLKESNQFRALDYDKITRSMVIHDPNKGFIAKDGIIIDAFANLYSSF